MRIIVWTDGTEVDNYAVRLHYGGKEKRLSLRTPNRELAAALARDWYVGTST
jgi:hypothetical protein